MSRASLTDDEARALGERWVKAGGGWIGLLIPADEREPVRVLGTSAADIVVYGVQDGVMHRSAWWVSTNYEGPDLRDPATRGACLEVVRERWRDPTIYIEVGFLGPDTPPNYWLRSGGGRDEPYANETSEAACLVAAIEAVPR